MSNVPQQIFIMNTNDNQPSSTTETLIEVPSSGPLQVNLENIRDFTNVCRTCATVTDFVVPIYNGEGLQNNLAEKITKYMPIQVTEHDLLPHVLCYQCANTLLAWHELVKCCVQADAALRSRLPFTNTVTQLPTTSETQSNQNGTNNQTNKFRGATIGKPIEPPPYVESSTSVDPESTKICVFCKSELPQRVYDDHLIGAHAEQLFHCEECDTYVDRKEFIMHMSLHAADYANVEKNLQREFKRIIRRRVEVPSAPKFPKTPPPPVLPPIPAPATAPDPKKIKNNEFSDQDDIDFIFEPLPESVFDAIEDSQDLPTCQAKKPAPIVKTADTKDNSKTAKWFKTCSICSKEYTASSSFFYHMKHFHGKSKDHECDVCGKKFATKANLVEHGSIHTGECKFECKVCKKRFRAKASLYIHSQTQACGGAGGEGGGSVWRHTCPRCGRVFRWRTHLSRHMSRHAPHKPHACRTCGRAFSVKCDLLRHERTHSAGEHACTHCGLKFAQMRYLKVHVEKKHSKSKGKK